MGWLVRHSQARKHGLDRRMILILQWNARSLVANGLEFKSVINEMEVKPDLICIQESWLKPRFVLLLKDM